MFNRCCNNSMLFIIQESFRQLHTISLPSNHLLSLSSSLIKMFLTLNLLPCTGLGAVMHRDSYVDFGAI